LRPINFARLRSTSELIWFVMDRSTLRLPDPALRPPGEDRRRTVRQKLHTPIYVSFQAASAGMTLDLNELLDIHENGFAVQTAGPSGTDRNGRLEVHRTVPLRLDLTESKNYIEGTGQVIWIDNTGRAGIRFSSLPDRSRLLLKEWLFANLLIASTNHASRAQQMAQRQLEELPGEAPAPASSGPASPAPGTPEHVFPDDQLPAPVPKLVAVPAIMPEPAPAVAEPVSPVPDRAQLLAALDDVFRHVRHIRDRALELHDGGQDYEDVLHLITGSAMSLTGATGAALALLTNDRMICRASAGDPAPPVGSEMDVRSGLSGECIRSGLLVSCEDTESDLRVDPEVCRAFRIGSFMAAPIFVDFRVVGLLEIFSPYPHSFTTVHATILQRLVEVTPHTERNQAEKSTVQERAPEPAEIEIAKPEPAPIELESIPAVRNPEKYELVSSDLAETDLAKPPATPAHLEEQALPPLPPPVRGAHYGHFALLVLVLGTIALVMGYLLAPTIQKHWMTPAESSQSSGASAPQASVQTSPSLPLQNAADHQSHPVSPEELRKLANQGDADAQWQLGTLYHDGLLVPQDDAQAVQWFQRSAEQGYVRAQATLGSYYWAGRGVRQDYSKAYFWSQLALAQGDQNSKLLLEGLSTQMTQSQITKARQEAELWIHSHTQAAKPSPGVK
jgi:GAF domain/Sel1 repeat/PilZ domain